MRFKNPQKELHIFKNQAITHNRSDTTFSCFYVRFLDKKNNFNILLSFRPNDEMTRLHNLLKSIKKALISQSFYIILSEFVIQLLCFLQLI